MTSPIFRQLGICPVSVHCLRHQHDGCQAQGKGGGGFAGNGGRGKKERRNPVRLSIAELVGGTVLLGDLVELPDSHLIYRFDDRICRDGELSRRRGCRRPLQTPVQERNMLAMKGCPVGPDACQRAFLGPYTGLPFPSPA